MKDGAEFSEGKLNITQVHRYEDDDAMKHPVRIGLFDSTLNEEEKYVDVAFESGSIVHKDVGILEHILNYDPDGK